MKRLGISVAVLLAWAPNTAFGQEDLPEPEVPEDMKVEPVKPPRTTKLVQSRAAGLTLTSGERVCGEVLRSDELGVVLLRKDGARETYAPELIAESENVPSCQAFLSRTVAPPPKPERDESLDWLWLSLMGAGVGTVGILPGALVGGLASLGCPTTREAPNDCQVLTISVGAGLGLLVGANLTINAFGETWGRKGGVAPMVVGSVLGGFVGLVGAPFTFGITLPLGVGAGAALGYLLFEEDSSTTAAFVPMPGGGAFVYGFRF